MAGLVGVLQSLGATRQRDGSYGFDCSVLQLGSMFGGDLDGPAVVVVAGEAVTFKSPLELAACGKVWMTDVADDDAFCQALGVALDELREQTRGALATLRRLGCKARVQAPDPRARGVITHDGHAIGVVIDGSGDLVCDTFDGELLPEGRQASMMAPDEASPEEFARLLEQVCLDLADGEATGIVAGGGDEREPALSEEELNELQAALSDDDDGGDGDDADGFADDDERTAAAAPLPPPRAPVVASDDDSIDDVEVDFSDEADEVEAGTVELRVSPHLKPSPAAAAHGFDDDDDDDDDEPPTATLTTPIAKAALPPIRVPTRRVEAPAPPAPGPDLSGVDDDDDPFDGIGEPTATRPVGARPTVVPASQPDEGGGLLDALGDDDGDDEGDDPYDNNPTSVRGADGSSVPVAAPVMADVARPAATAHDDFEDDNGFDEATGTLGGGATDDEQDGKTRALVIDADLLARLKLGDGDKASAVRQAVGAPQADKPLTGLATAPLRPRPAAPTDDDFDAPPTSATPLAPQTRAEDEPPSIAATIPPAVDDDDDEESDLAAAFADGFDDGDADDDDGRAPPPAMDDDIDDDIDDELDDVLAHDDRGVTVGHSASAPRHTVGDDAFGSDAADGFDDGATTGLPPGVRTAVRDDDAELASLQLRAASLEAELLAVRSRIGALLDARLGGRESTGSSTSTARSPATATEHVAAAPRGAALQPRVGDSDEGDVVETAASGGFTSLPSMKSVDVHLLKGSVGGAPLMSGAAGGGSASGSTGNSLLDAFDDDDPSLAVSDAQASVHPSGFDDEPDDADDAARRSTATRDVRPNAVAANDGDDEVVSLAALQGALKELGVIGESNETQVAASVMDFAPGDDGDGDGDVFGSGSGGDSLADEAPSKARSPELSEEATRIRTTRLSSIALVVEDDRARDRLRKHLAERFSALIEARDGQAALRLKGISAVDAIVFVRPRNDDDNLATLTRLEALPHRPRILVISHDEAFDELGAVDLRLPLGQRASEVAQQVLDGLERLGIALAPAA